MTITTCVSVFFAANPDEELTHEDISTKWGMHPDSCRRSLQNAEENGWVVRTRREDKTARQKWRWFYTPGPRLLKEIGLVRPDSGVLAQIEVDEPAGTLLLHPDAGEAEVHGQAQDLMRVSAL